DAPCAVVAGPGRARRLGRYRGGPRPLAGPALLALRDRRDRGGARLAAAGTAGAPAPPAAARAAASAREAEDGPTGRPGRVRPVPGRFHRRPAMADVSPARTIRAPRGPDISCKSWQQEAAL